MHRPYLTCLDRTRSPGKISARGADYDVWCQSTFSVVIAYTAREQRNAVYRTCGFRSILARRKA